MYDALDLAELDLDDQDLDDVGFDDVGFDDGTQEGRSVGDAPADFGRRLIGLRVRRRRLDAALSQRQLAWRCGVTQSTVSRLECGTLTGMRLSTLARVEAALVGRYRDDGFLDPPPAPRRRLPGMPTAAYEEAER